MKKNKKRRENLPLNEKRIDKQRDSACRAKNKRETEEAIKRYFEQEN